MGEAQNLGINLDQKSIDILKKVDSIHRDSLINVGLALVSKTGYYKTLAGISDAEDLEDVASLDIENEDEDDKPVKTSKKPGKNSKEIQAPTKKPSASWDTF